MSGVTAARSRRVWSLTDSYGFISTFIARSATRRHVNAAQPRHTEYEQLYTTERCERTACTSCNHSLVGYNKRPESDPHREQLSAREHRRNFHEYFVTHLPSSSLHPDSRSFAGPGHKLPRSASTPHTGPGRSPAAAPPTPGPSRELTVVRIPLKSAKHHFGASVARGNRPYQEDRYQAGTIEVPAFARRAPISLSRKGPGKDGTSTATSAESASGDPQVFYFGVFDGHGGDECSQFLKDELHTYIEEASGEFQLASSLKADKAKARDIGEPSPEVPGTMDSELSRKGKESLASIDMKSKDDVKQDIELPVRGKDGAMKMPEKKPAIQGEAPREQSSNKALAQSMQTKLVAAWKDTVGGYFRRFKPDYFDLSSPVSEPAPVSIETVLMYSFLKADLDFITAQASKPDPDSSKTSDLPLNNDEVLGSPSQTPKHHKIGGSLRFKGGSTCSIAMISTPTPTPFWHPASPSTMLVAHVGDTRILLCETATGLAVPVTTNHHPSSPIEGTRLRRYAATFVTDSFGEERMSGLANTRSFGDMRSKRIGVSAEPEVVRLELAPAQYSFLVLVSDGVSGNGVMSDQEIVDVVKEAKTPEQGARDVVGFATEVTREGDNATCLVVRLGGWERRGEGGVGSLGTKEGREWRRSEASDPRAGRT